MDPWLKIKGALLNSLPSEGRCQGHLAVLGGREILLTREPQTGQRHGHRVLLLLILCKVRGCNILQHSLVKGLSEHPRAYELGLCFMESHREGEPQRIPGMEGYTGHPPSGTPGVKTNRK